MCLFCFVFSCESINHPISHLHPLFLSPSIPSLPNTLFTNFFTISLLPFTNQSDFNLPSYKFQDSRFQDSRLFFVPKGSYIATIHYENNKDYRWILILLKKSIQSFPNDEQTRRILKSSNCGSKIATTTKNVKFAAIVVEI